MARQLSAATYIESLRYPSWCLCRLLDKIIGTKDEVALRRKKDAMFYYTFNKTTHNKMLYSGSRGEGFKFQSSDADIMLIDEDNAVLESVQSIRSNDDRGTVLFLTREGCNPGFVIVRLLNGTNDRGIIESVVEHDGHPVVSSLLYRDVHRDTDVGQVGHGPCNTLNYSGDIDLANCFKCNTWPTEAQEFIHRQRPHGWPPKSLLDKIICRGCHLVPIGDRDPDLSHIQWRLSFSEAEKDLVHSFNHTHFLVYGLMKIVLKQFINKCQFVNDILCSYFLKTAMFYSIECTPSSFWREDLLIPCFWFCLNKLIHWVEQGYCPNYFVVQNNMFRGKVFGETQRNLLTVLRRCKHFGWPFICLCEDLQLLEHFHNQLEWFSSKRVIPNENERESCSDGIVHSALDGLHIVPPQNLQKYLLGPLTLLSYSRTQTEEDISMLLLYNTLRCTGEMHACLNVGINNKNNYKKSYHMLLTSAASNIYTGSLYLATFYYLTEQYRKAVYVCNRVILQWKPYVMYYSTAHNRDMYERYVCGRGVSVLDKTKSSYAFDISINPYTKHFYPAELRYDVEASHPFEVFIPPIPYTVFLSFMCHQKLGNIDDSVTALHYLKVLAYDKPQGCIGYPIVLNMLAACLHKLGDVQGAVEMCLLSQTVKPDSNGAVKMLEKLLKKFS